MKPTSSPTTDPDDAFIECGIRRCLHAQSKVAPSAGMGLLVGRVRSKVGQLSHGQDVHFDDMTIGEALRHLLSTNDDAEGNIRIATPTGEPEEDIGNRR